MVKPASTGSCAEFRSAVLDYEQRLPGLLGEVTREKVNAIARYTLSPDHAAIVIAGPYEEHAG